MHRRLQTNAQRLTEKGIITEEESVRIGTRLANTFFSILPELQALLYAAVLLFTSGCGMLIYLHIDAIGHLSIIAGIFIVQLICYGIAFRQSPGFANDEVPSVNVITEYLVLAGAILVGSFVGYIQYQYTVFGNLYWLATLIPTLIWFATAYYFDHKGILSMAITGLAAVVGFSSSPQSMLNNDFSSDQFLAISSILLGMSLVAISHLADRKGIKTHFSFTYRHFALHFIALPCLANMLHDNFWIYLIVLAPAMYYFYRQAYHDKSVLFLFFTLFYSYIALNIQLGRLLANTDLAMALVYLMPFYFGGSIALFIRVLKSFKKEI